MRRRAPHKDGLSWADPKQGMDEAEDRRKLEQPKLGVDASWQTDGSWQTDTVQAQRTSEAVTPFALQREESRQRDT